MIAMSSPSYPIESIVSALAAHAAWKQRFAEFMAGATDLDPQQIENNNCIFGKWLDEEGACQLSAQDYKLVYKLHAQFHQVAAAIVRLKKSGHLEEAQAHLRIGGDFPKASAQLSSCLIAIREKGIALLEQQLDAAQN
jgi:Chemoreceptor zinc-binding domain